jgi:hypothetical protein
MKITRRQNIMATVIALGLGLFPSARAATATPADEAVAQRIKALEKQITASQGQISTLEYDLKSLDGRIDKRITKTVELLKGLADSRDSGTKVARIKEDVIDFIRKQISDYSRRRAQLRAALDNPNFVIPAKTIEGDIAKIDARIDLRIAQAVALGCSFATHQDYDKYKVTSNSWYGGTDYRLNEDYEQDRKVTTKAGQEKGKLTSAIDENIKRLEFTNRSIRTRMDGPSARSIERMKGDIARNEALIDALRGHRVELLLPPEQKMRALGLKEAQAIYLQLKETGVEIRRDQNTLTGIYNNLNAERATLAPLVSTLSSLKKPVPAKQ